MIDSTIRAFNTLSPLGLSALLGYIIYLLVAKKSPFRTLNKSVSEISLNHLSGLPEMAATLARIEATLVGINNSIQYLNGRLDRNFDLYSGKR